MGVGSHAEAGGDSPWEEAWRKPEGDSGLGGKGAVGGSPGALTALVHEGARWFTADMSGGTL